MSDYCGKHNAFYEALDVMRMEKDIDDILDLVDNLESLTAHAETRQAADKEDRECWKDVADLVDAALPTTVARLHRHALEALCETTRKMVVTAIIAVEKRISEAAEGWRAAARVGAEMEWRGVHHWMDSGKKPIFGMRMEKATRLRSELRQACRERSSGFAGIAVFLDQVAPTMPFQDEWKKTTSHRGKN
ncbi:unnamed protein product, partial [Mesorhabditis spiculigera]